jgi:two-component sensor histidine kinase
VNVELGLRFPALRVGYFLGWASILAVVSGLALDVGAPHRWLLAGATLAAAAGNAVAMVIPWREWLAQRRGQLLLDLWCGGLIAFVAVLVLDGGPSFSLLLFLVVPFITVVQSGRRRVVWLSAAALVCAGVATLTPQPAGEAAMRLALVATTAAATLVLARAIRREAERADVERALAREASHRIKNDLQIATDLLLLARPDGPDGAAFDEAAARIRSIAHVHRLLTAGGDRVDGAALLRSIADDAPTPVTVDAEPGTFDAGTAQKLGLVANELLTNAFRHGAPPVVVRLRRGDETQLSVEDGGAGHAGEAGFGLELVRRLVELGLHGRVELAGNRAVVVFPAVAR